jgi:hypothetical protein
VCATSNFWELFQYSETGIPSIGVVTMAVNPQESEAIFAERFVKIICIGAGASGLLLAYKLSKHFDNYSLAVSFGAIGLHVRSLTTVDLRKKRRYCGHMA